MSTNDYAPARRFRCAAVLTGAFALGAVGFGLSATAIAEPSPQVENVQTPPLAETQHGDSARKLRLKGVVTRRDADTFTVRDMNGVDTR